jgi:transcriptional regulator with XRE-family HTH domain
MGAAQCAMPDKKRSLGQIAKNRAAMRNVFAWLDHLDISQRQLAEHLEISEAQISKWKSGTASPSFDRIIGISSFLGISPDKMLGREPGSLPEHSSEFQHRKDEVALLGLWDAMPQEAKDATMAFLRATYGHFVKRDDSAA